MKRKECERSGIRVRITSQSQAIIICIFIYKREKDRNTREIEMHLQKRIMPDYTLD